MDVDGRTDVTVPVPMFPAAVGIWDPGEHASRGVQMPVKKDVGRYDSMLNRLGNKTSLFPAGNVTFPLSACSPPHPTIPYLTSVPSIARTTRNAPANRLAHIPLTRSNGLYTSLLR